MDKTEPTLKGREIIKKNFDMLVLNQSVLVSFRNEHLVSNKLFNLGILIVIQGMYAGLLFISLIGTSKLLLALS